MITTIPSTVCPSEKQFLRGCYIMFEQLCKVVWRGREGKMSTFSVHFAPRTTTCNVQEISVPPGHSPPSIFKGVSLDCPRYERLNTGWDGMGGIEDGQYETISLPYSTKTPSSPSKHYLPSIIKSKLPPIFNGQLCLSSFP